MFGRHAERRGEAVRSREISAAPGASNAYYDGASMAAALTDVLGTKENVVHGIGSRARAIGDAARQEVREYLAKSTRSGVHQTVESLSEDVHGLATLMSLIWEGQCVERLAKTSCFGPRGWASVGQEVQKIALETAG